MVLFSAIIHRISFISSLGRQKYHPKFVEEADRYMSFLIKYLFKVPIILCPINVISTSAGMVLYNKWRNGYIDPHTLYRTFLFVYGILKYVMFINFLY